MAETKKTPAELLAEKAKAEKNTEAGNTQEPTVDLAKEVERLTKELSEKVTENETLSKEKEKVEKKVETLSAENTKLKEDLASTPAESNAIVDLDNLKVDDEKESKPLNHDVFVCAGTHKTVSYGGFTFEKGKEYPVTGRMKRAMEFLVEQKHGKIKKAQ